MANIGFTDEMVHPSRTLCSLLDRLRRPRPDSHDPACGAAAP